MEILKIVIIFSFVLLFFFKYYLHITEYDKYISEIDMDKINDNIEVKNNNNIGSYVSGEYTDIMKEVKIKPLKSGIECVKLKCNDDIVKNKAKKYYEKLSKGQQFIIPLRGNNVDDEICDINFKYLPTTDSTNNQYGYDKRRFTYKLNPYKCSWNVEEMDEYRSGKTVCTLESLNCNAENIRNDESIISTKMVDINKCKMKYKNGNERTYEYKVSPSNCVWYRH